MANKTVKTFKTDVTTCDILNAMRNSASTNYREYVPECKCSGDIKEIGGIIMQYDFLRNEFCPWLINRIARVITSSKLYKNPLAIFKKGMIEYGETVEDVFVSLIKAENFDPKTADQTVFKRRLPNLKTAFYSMNFQKVYPVTISKQQLSQAFLSENGVLDLIAKITDSIYTSASYDELLVTKYCIAKNLIEGRIAVKNIEGMSVDDVTAIIKSTSNDFTFLSSDYNVAGVTTYSNKDDQYILMSSKFDAENSVKVLSSAFNLEYADFIGKRTIINSFGFSNDELERLTNLLKDSPNYVEFSSEENDLLNEIGCVLVDRDFLQIYDNLYDFTEQYNANGLYWNYFNHVWKTFAISPFANACTFITGKPTVSSVTITPSELTLSKGTSTQLEVNVETTNLAPQSVTWTSDNEDVTIDTSGKVYVNDKANGTVEITATSTYDSTKTGKCNITIL